MFTFYVCIYLINFSDLLVGCLRIPTSSLLARHTLLYLITMKFCKKNPLFVTQIETHSSFISYAIVKLIDLSIIDPFSDFIDIWRLKKIGKSLGINWYSLKDTVILNLYVRNKPYKKLTFQMLKIRSSCSGLEVEEWSDIRTLSISVDPSPLGACMIIWYQWTRYVMYILDVCYMFV